MKLAKHDFKVQVRVGEFVHFRKGQVVPEKFYENESPYRDYVLQHCESGIIKPQIIVSPDMKRFADRKEEIDKARETKETKEEKLDEETGETVVVEPSAKLTEEAPKEAGKTAAKEDLNPNPKKPKMRQNEPTQ